MRLHSRLPVFRPARLEGLAVGLLVVGLTVGELRAEPEGSRSPEAAKAGALTPPRDEPRETGLSGPSKGAADGVPSTAAGEIAPPESPWCAPELEVLAEGYCYSPLPAVVRPGVLSRAEAARGSAERGAPAVVAPAVAAPPSATTRSKRGVSSAQEALEQPRTLVIFLHSLVTARTDWQWQQQRMLARSGEKNGFAVLFPRGRLGIGPGRDRNTWAWPGSTEAQKLCEDEVIDGWLAQKARLEQRDGSFDEVFVFGFSNGAYYATNLAMRGRFPADGYGVFAGGSGSRYHRILAQSHGIRAPVFVGFGTKDPDHHRQIALIDLLRDFHWPHHFMSARVGHMVTDSQLEAAVKFLRSKREPSVSEPSVSER